MIWRGRRTCARSVTRWWTPGILISTRLRHTLVSAARTCCSEPDPAHELSERNAVMGSGPAGCPAVAHPSAQPELSTPVCVFVGQKHSRHHCAAFKALQMAALDFAAVADGVSPAAVAGVPETGHPEIR